MRVCEICRARYKGSPTVCPLDGGRLLELPDPLLGRTIAARYLLVEKVGAGGMGVVYRARHDAAGREVAIKFLLSELALDPTNRQRFLREAKAANRIDHENIIDVADFGETDDGLVYLVMEYLHGISLAEEVTRGRLRVPRAIHVAMQCASALARAHELDVVHRDIKPENIYLLPGEGGRDFVKLLDFGLAHMKGELRLTATGAVFGTPEYMAPEQARGAPLTGLADLYALGCVIFEMLTGQPPFSGSTPDLILQHMRHPAPLASSKQSDIPAAIDAIVARLLEKDPTKRHRDGYHLLEDLRRIAEVLPVPERPVIPWTSANLNATMPSPSSLSLPADSSGPLVPEKWEARTALFRQLALRAHPGSGVPSWLPAAIDELEAQIKLARAAEASLTEADTKASEHEAHFRGLRLRLGRAVDELGNDESRTAGLIQDLGVALREARDRAAELEGRLLTQLGSLEKAPALTRDLAQEVADAGALSSRWLEADGAISDLTTRMANLEQEHDDLRFQLAQLKGRLGTLSAEGDLEIRAAQQQSVAVERDLDKLLEDIHTRAVALVRYYSEFPELKAEVAAAALPSEPARRSKRPKARP